MNTKEQIKDYNRQYYQKHKKEIKKQKKEYRELHKKEIQQLIDRWRKEHKQYTKKYNNDYYQKHKTECKTYMRIYRALKNGKRDSLRLAQCRICGRLFFVPKRCLTDTKYCSEDCRKAGRRLNRLKYKKKNSKYQVCKNCGMLFVKPFVMIKRDGKTRSWYIQKLLKRIDYKNLSTNQKRMIANAFQVSKSLVNRIIKRIIDGNELKAEVLILKTRSIKYCSDACQKEALKRQVKQSNQRKQRWLRLQGKSEILGCRVSGD